MELCEHIAQIYRNETEHGNESLIGGGSVTNDCWYTLGQASGYIIATVTKNGNYYSATVTYNLCDYYDWIPGQIARGGFVLDSEMALLHKAGEAKEFEITGSYTFEMNWINGGVQ